MLKMYPEELMRFATTSDSSSIAIYRVCTNHHKIREEYAAYGEEVQKAKEEGTDTPPVPSFTEQEYTYIIKRHFKKSRHEFDVEELERDEDLATLEHIFQAYVSALGGEEETL